MEQGSIIIWPKIDTRGLNRDIQKLEHKLKNTEADIEIKAVEVDSQKKAIADLNEELKKAQNEFDKMNAKAQRFSELKAKKEYLEVGSKEHDEYLELRTMNIENEQQMLQQKIEEINSLRDKELLKLEKQEQKLENLNYQYNEIGNKIKNIKHDEITKGLNNIKGTIDSVVKKTVKWGLAIFGVRSAYMFVRQAMSTISQYDNQLATNLQYIKYVLAMSIKPIIDWIVNAAYTLLSYINYIANAWFGINLFANASVENFQQANKSANKLKKTLAGFDEMNILNDNSEEGISVPSLDLSQISDEGKPWWIKWIAENKDTVLNFLKEMAIIIGTIKFAQLALSLKGLFTGTYSLGLLSSTLGKLGIIAGGIAITGIIAKTVWDETQELANELETIRENGAKYQEKWIENEENINTLITTGNVNRQAGYNLLDKTNGLFYKYTGLGEQNLKTAMQVSENLQKQIDKEMELYRTTDLEKQEKDKILKNVMDQITYNEALIKKMKENGQETQGIQEKNKILMGYANEIYKDTSGTGEELYDINQMKLNDKNFTVKIDADTSSAEKKTSSWLSGLGEIGLHVAGVTGSIVAPGLNRVALGATFLKKLIFGAKGMIYTPPKLALGGIINQPGRGVPLGSAFGGERGMEGVIPLTDSQQMELLGKAIGRYITLNANITNNMNGRVISRELQKINLEDNFAFNK